MIIIDFVFYFVVLFFKKNPQRLKWSTPIQITSYLVGTATLLYILALIELLKFTVMKWIDFGYITKFAFVITALLLMELYDYIYGKKKRYEKISDMKFTKIKYRTGFILSLIFIFGSFFLAALIFIHFVPAGSGVPH